MSRSRLFFPVTAAEWPTTTSTSVFFLVRSAEVQSCHVYWVLFIALSSIQPSVTWLAAVVWSMLQFFHLHEYWKWVKNGIPLLSNDDAQGWRLHAFSERLSRADGEASAPRLAAYPGGSPPLLHIPVATCNSAFISVRTVQVYPTLFGQYRRGMFVYQTKTSIARLNFRLYFAKYELTDVLAWLNFLKMGTVAEYASYSHLCEFKSRKEF